MARQNDQYRRGSGQQTRNIRGKPDPTNPKRKLKKGVGVPGRDFSGVDPDTGKYVVVRGNFVGVHEERLIRRGKNLKKDLYKNEKTYKPGERNPNSPKTPMDRQRKSMKICGASRTGKSSAGPGICCQPAGWGTAHLGYGHCRLHGGLTESQEKAVEIQRATDMIEMYGTPINDMDPHTALLQEVQRSAGHVKWLAELINTFEDKKQLTQYTDATGIQPSVWIDLYHKERDRLVTSARNCISAGVAERQVRIAEEQGRMFAAVIKAIFMDPRLAITNVQRSIMPAVVRDHMLALDSDTPATAHLVEEAILVETQRDTQPD